jgi:hypothetical protein
MKEGIKQRFLILGLTLELTYYVFFFHQISSRKESYLKLHKQVDANYKGALFVSL